MRHLIGSAVVLIIVLGTGGAFSGTPSAEKLCIPTGTIVLKAPDGVQAQRAEVAFPHSRHFAITCQTCHHTWEGDAQLQGCTSSDCHDLTAPAKSTGQTPAPAAIAYYKNAFHTQCIGCHKTILKHNAERIASRRPIEGQLPASGPTACIGCHPK